MEQSKVIPVEPLVSIIPLQTNGDATLPNLQPSISPSISKTPQKQQSLLDLISLSSSSTVPSLSDSCASSSPTNSNHAVRASPPAIPVLNLKVQPCINNSDAKTKRIFTGNTQARSKTPKLPSPPVVLPPQVINAITGIILDY